MPGPAAGPRAIAVTVALLLATVVACGASDAGETCEEDGDCASGKCALLGRCAPGECTCTGAECGTVQGGCDDGRVCVAGLPPLEVGYNRCRRRCDPATANACGQGEKCQSGLCVAGAEPFLLAWRSFPRTTPCQSRALCTYRVEALGGVEVETYTWTFGNAPPTDTTTPDTGFTYVNPGTFPVTVKALAKSGAEASLQASEVVCIPSGSGCAPTGPACCAGTCDLSKNLCP